MIATQSSSLSSVAAKELSTDRLRLRGWRPSDRPVFATMNADPDTMRYLPRTLSTDESDAFAERIADDLDRNGYGLWAVEVPDVAPFIGFVGLAVPDFDAPFTPAVEVGWRIAAHYQGNGYALEAARAVLAYAFSELGLDQVVSFTSVANEPSWRLMERLGMEADPASSFDHPRLSADSPLRRHVLYRAEATSWLRRHHNRRVVRAPWTASQKHPIVVSEGDRVTVGRRDDEWTDYRWCVAETGETSWLPVSILEIREDGTGVALRDYSAAELTVGAGDVVEVEERIAGWSWCVTESGRAGWVPDRVLGA